MALWKPFRGNRAALSTVDKHDGYIYFCIDDGSLFFDYIDGTGNLQRKQINAKEAEVLLGYTVTSSLNYSDTEIPTSKAIIDALDGHTVQTSWSKAVDLTTTEEVSCVKLTSTDDGVDFASKNITQAYILITNAIQGTSTDGDFYVEINMGDTNALPEATRISAGAKFIKQASQKYWAGYYDIDRGTSWQMSSPTIHSNWNSIVQPVVSANKQFMNIDNIISFDCYAGIGIPAGTKIEIWVR